MNEPTLQDQIDELNARMNAFNASPTIPLQVDNALNARGFSKTTIDAGNTRLNSKGFAYITIPSANKTSIALATPTDVLAGFTVSAAINIAYQQTQFGASSSRFDITNPVGTTFRYTWDGIGTNPGITAAKLPIGSLVVIDSANFNTANNGTFTVTGSGADYFEVTNALGVAENDKTLGSTNPKPLVGGPKTANTYWLVLRGTGSTVAYAVFTNTTTYKDTRY